MKTTFPLPAKLRSPTMERALLGKRQVVEPIPYARNITDALPFAVKASVALTLGALPFYFLALAAIALGSALQ